MGQETTFVWDSNNQSNITLQDGDTISLNPIHNGLSGLSGVLGGAYQSGDAHGAFDVALAQQRAESIIEHQQARQRAQQLARRGSAWQMPGKTVQLDRGNLTFHEQLQAEVNTWLRIEL